MFGTRFFAYQFCKNWLSKRPGLVFWSSVATINAMYQTRPLYCESVTKTIQQTYEGLVQKRINNEDELFLLGSGPRYVSFLSIHVYDIELYIQKKDVQTVHTILQKEVDPKLGLEMSMKDEEIGSRIVAALLKNEMKYAIKIVPTRNTNFSHLRGGFVRGLQSRMSQNDPAEQAAVSKFRSTFPVNRTCFKETALWMKLYGNDFCYIYKDSEIGHMHDENYMVSNLFLKGYLVGPRVNSEQARESVCLTLRRIMDGTLLF
ncbi:Chalcone like protein family [Schizosaccharomyces pombe]|uniref:Uncharacterized protein C18G6.01c n=1 Tax=Schizosaccharomyces pombe (strain 972 / ATCC 24843) TaxID=284812 RepID=YAQ1_SCHPO|nr:chalcone related protein [Schizosaccharomyces pombe]Q10102.1 RecName: Full=Uncharacterized protein C18G6.01c [Schizosaccharomyces pombe 972h-]CAA92381.1 calchone related protein family [Schizosaccharomyces pombe]|eukprot:NP_593665.1 chalcone related protein [Schizosaccharomyces pombe]